MRDDSPWDKKGFRLKKHPDSSNRQQENKKIEHVHCTIVHRLGLTCSKQGKGVRRIGAENLLITSWLQVQNCPCCTLSQIGFAIKIWKHTGECILAKQTFYKIRIGLKI